MKVLLALLLATILTACLADESSVGSAFYAADAGGEADTGTDAGDAGSDGAASSCAPSQVAVDVCADQPNPIKCWFECLLVFGTANACPTKCADACPEQMFQDHDGCVPECLLFDASTCP